MPYNVFISDTKIYKLSLFLAFEIKNHQQSTRTQIAITLSKLYSAPKRSIKYYLDNIVLQNGCHSKFCLEASPVQEQASNLFDPHAPKRSKAKKLFEGFLHNGDTKKRLLKVSSVREIQIIQFCWLAPLRSTLLQDFDSMLRSGLSICWAWRVSQKSPH